MEVRLWGADMYWRSDWEWLGDDGGLQERIALAAWTVGPPIAAALAYGAVSVAGLERTS